MEEQRNVRDYLDSRRKSLYYILKSKPKTEDPAEDIRFAAFSQQLIYFNRDKTEENALMSEAVRLSMNLFALIKKENMHADDVGTAAFDMLFSKEELDLFDKWLAPLKVEKNEKVSAELMIKNHVIDRVEKLRKKSENQKLNKWERGFLKRNKSVTLTDEERQLLDKYDNAIHREQCRRIGESSYTDALWGFVHDLNVFFSFHDEKISSDSFISNYLLHRLDMLGKIRIEPVEPDVSEE